MYYYHLTESGKRLKALRHKRGKAYTQERVAEEIGITREYLSCLETGKKGCSVDMLVVFAQYYGVTTDYITYGKEETRFSEKMDRLSEEHRTLAEKLINCLLENLLQE